MIQFSNLFFKTTMNNENTDISENKSFYQNFIKKTQM
jgi:hypothetical protein